MVYLRGHEGRGIGLVAKLQAYQLQDGGRDTVDANLDLGLPADARHYGTATQVLRDLEVESVRLLTNNPDKVHNLEDFGVPVAERVPLTPHPNDHNLAYLLTKRDRMGHDLPAPDRRPHQEKPAMSGPGAPDQKPVDCHDLRVAIVAASWHEQVMDGLVDGAQRACKDYRVEAPVLVRVPGTFELPGRGGRARRAGVRRRRRARRRDPRRHAALRLRLQRRHRRPRPGRPRPPVAVGFGVLTCDTEEQALDRAGLDASREDKGYEATSAALVTAQTLQGIKRGYDA